MVVLNDCLIPNCTWFIITFWHEFQFYSCFLDVLPILWRVAWKRHGIYEIRRKILQCKRIVSENFSQNHSACILIALDEQLCPISVHLCRSRMRWCDWINVDFTIPIHNWNCFLLAEQLAFSFNFEEKLICYFFFFLIKLLFQPWKWLSKRQVYDRTKLSRRFTIKYKQWIFIVSIFWSL